MVRSCDIVIRIRGASDNSGSRFPVEAQIDGSGLWQGESIFDFDRLDAGALTKEQYGKLLAQQLINPAIGRALDFAGLGQGKPVSIRLSILEEPSTAFLRWIRWERLYIPTGGDACPIAIAPNVAFSRYIPDERADADAPSEPVFRLLLAIANPTGLDASRAIDVEKEIGTLLDEFAGVIPTARFQVRVMPGRSPISDDLKKRLRDAEWDLDDGNTTLDNIGDRLNSKNGRCHALHLICHGQFDRANGVGKLFLEDDAGALKETKDYELQSWIHPQLQLILFQSCKTAAPPPAEAPPFTGIAPRVVKFGVPAVIAMQDYVQMVDARAFSAAFYRSLLRDGFVDSAVNEGRRAIPQAVERVDSTIPALFMRIREGRLWQPDPVRQDILETDQRMEAEPSFPLKVVHHTCGLDYDPLAGPDGPQYDLATRLSDLIPRARVTCLTGPPGFDKTIQLRLQFKKLAKEYLEGGPDHKTDIPAPFFVDVGELSQWGRFQTAAVKRDLRGNLQAVASGSPVPPELQERIFTFLVSPNSGERELSDSANHEAVRVLAKLLKAFPKSRCLIVYGETQLAILKDLGLDFGPVAVLVVRPMEWSEVRRYLNANQQSQLVEEVETRQLTDLAGVPWLLTELQDLAHYGNVPKSRAEALSMVASSYLTDLDTRQIPRSIAEQALERMAWQIQWDRTPLLDNAAVLAILYDVRGQRDFRVGDLLGQLVRCKFVAPVGDECLRFPFNALQAYFAARYLLKSPRMSALLEDITAALGRFSRMRHWEKTMIALAGLQTTSENRISLLQTILAGSSLSEGEQVFLAARMYTEMGDPALENDKVVGQIVDTLIWRSRPDVPRPYAERKQAAQHLAAMCHPSAIRHLIALAASQFHIPSIGYSGEERFDYSGIRLTAVNGLLLQYQKALEYLKGKDSGLPAESVAQFNSVIEAWMDLVDKRTEKMEAILQAHDPSLSPVAAFALGLAGRELGGPILLKAYFQPQSNPALANPARSGDHDVTWALTEMLAQQDADWLAREVVERWLGKEGPLPPPNQQLCYLIQMLGSADPGTRRRSYLCSCLTDDAFVSQGRALRALSKLNDPEIEAWLRPLCEQIIQSNFDQEFTRRTGIKSNLEQDNLWRLQQAALEILRDIGDARSLEIVRSTQFQMKGDLVLSALGFQVAEQMYWRLTGGLAKEKFGRNGNGK